MTITRSSPDARSPVGVTGTPLLKTDTATSQEEL